MKAGNLKVGKWFKVFGHPYLFQVVGKTRKEVICNIFGMDGLCTYPRTNLVISL